MVLQHLSGLRQILGIVDDVPVEQLPPLLKDVTINPPTRVVDCALVRTADRYVLYCEILSGQGVPA